ncbi:MAG TPA: ATP-binding protein [Gemmatimonadaceae bacterium]|jgi:signal transduction histidine kinase
MPNTMPRGLLSLESYLVVVLAALGFAMAVWVFRANPRGRENQGFSLMVLSIVSWVSCYHLAQFGNPTLWFRLAAFAVFMLFVTYYFFIVVWFLGKRDQPYRLFGIVILLYGAVMGGLALGTDIVISGSAIAGSTARPVFGDGGRWAFYGFVIVLTLLINGILMREYMGFPRERRAKLQYFLIGLLLFAGFNIVFNVVLPLAFDDYAYYALGNYSVAFLLGFTAYAIVKRELFGVRAVLAAIFVATVGVLQTIDLLVFTEHPAIQAFKAAGLVLILCFGYVLVRSVQREVRQRERLQEIAEELRRSDEAKTEFISIVSHQLRTPLNTIKGYLSLLLEGVYGRLDTEKREPMERLSRSSERLIHLVNDLLGISRIQMGKIALDVGDVDLCEVVKSVVDEFGVVAEAKGIGLHASCPSGGVPVVAGDKQKLRDSVLNVVDNAIRYTEKGSVEVSVSREPNDLVVRVQDTGPGLDPEEARTLFESFQRGQVGRKHWAEGSGLGLYIAREFITLHGGAIWAESPGKGRGSSFFIRIPLGARKLAAA